MAAFDAPWLDHMSSPPSSLAPGGPSNNEPNTPTVAAFSPSTLSSTHNQRSTILVHQKSPLLVATPPQITRALAYSYPFLVPLNKLAGLLSWTTDDPWESFLLVAAFWFVTLYGSIVIRWAGPIVLGVGLILGMYSRRYSPLSTNKVTGEKGHKRGDSDANTRHHKSLDEIVDSLKLFTNRCNILLDPFLRLTDFLSTQRTATSATTRPALTTLFIRILLITPLWLVLTLPPFYIITTRRIILTLGTLALSWHSRPARVSRTILWRSRSIRRLCQILTGLDYGEPTPAPPKSKAPSDDNGEKPPALPPRKSASQIALSLAQKRRPSTDAGIRFTFTVYENQRRWLGIGWTSNMLAYERSSWTDEHLTACPPPSNFKLPEVEGGHAKWNWVEGSIWTVDGGEDGEGGWWYYDNKWRDGRRNDGWGRYTRRRKWCRDAELVEVIPGQDDDDDDNNNATAESTATLKPDHERNKSAASAASTTSLYQASGMAPDPDAASESTAVDNDDSSSTKAKKRRWFRRASNATNKSVATTSTAASVGSRDDDRHHDLHTPFGEREENWGVGEDYRMGLG